MATFCFLAAALVSSFLIISSRMSMASSYLEMNRTFRVWLWNKVQAQRTVPKLRISELSVSWLEDCRETADSAWKDNCLPAVCCDSPGQLQRLAPKRASPRLRVFPGSLTEHSAKDLQYLRSAGNFLPSSCEVSHVHLHQARLGLKFVSVNYCLTIEQNPKLVPSQFLYFLSIVGLFKKQAKDMQLIHLREIKSNREW